MDRYVCLICAYEYDPKKASNDRGHVHVVPHLLRPEVEDATRLRDDINVIQERIREIVECLDERELINEEDRWEDDMDKM